MSNQVLTQWSVGNGEYTMAADTRTLRSYMTEGRFAALALLSCYSFTCLEQRVPLLTCFLPEWESCSRGPVWLQALASGAVLESAGCSHSRGRRHTISI